MIYLIPRLNKDLLKKFKISKVGDVFGSELSATLNNPRRMTYLLDVRKMVRWYNTLPARTDIHKLRSSIADSWSSADDSRSLTKREYASYDEYLTHQKEKLRHIDLETYDKRYRTVLRERLKSMESVKPGDSVLCLAARLGTEVKSFIDLGCFAVGIDLNPGESNHYVVHGDFHNLQYSTNSVDVVFTNTFDHAYDMEGILNEIKRVLTDRGRLVVEASVGSDEGRGPGFFESYYWAQLDELVALLESSGFTLLNRMQFDYPWDGANLCFEKTAE